MEPTGRAFARPVGSTRATAIISTRLSSPRSNKTARRRRCSSGRPASSRHPGRARGARCSRISTARRRAGPMRSEWPTIAAPCVLLVQFLQVRSSPAANAVPSACDPVSTSWRFGVSPAAVDDLALFAERGLLGEVVAGAVQIGDVLGDHRALGILPRSLADAVARIDGRLAVGGLRREVGAPGFAAGAGGLRQRLAVIVGAGEAAEIAAIADAVAGQEETGIGRLRLRGRAGEQPRRRQAQNMPAR